MQDPVARTIHVSIVSHGHGSEVARLLRDLEMHAAAAQLRVVVTLNRDEALSFGDQDFAFPLKIQRNDRPKGYGANNNEAFRLAGPAPDDFFCLVNPDVRIAHDVFARLIECLDRDPKAGVVAPLVHNRDGGVEDNARDLPSPMTIVRKALGMREGPEPRNATRCQPVDWVAGLFMLFPARVYAAAGGFDERYFLYYEDVDLCCRLRLAGYGAFWVPGVSVIHDGRRDSHRRPGYFLLHLRSMARFFLSSTYRRARALVKSEKKRKRVEEPR